MKKILYIFIFAMLTVACLEEDAGSLPVDEGVGVEVISPSVKHAWTVEMPMSRALVDNLTTQAMEANFLRLDEDIDALHNGLYTYEAGSSEYNGKINWEKANIVEASVISSPDREGRRSVFLNPVQGYPLYVKRLNDTEVSTYYHTRLVSWYPRTCELIKDSETGMATDYIFDVYNSSMSGSGGSRYEAENGDVKIRFTGLNGEKDVMVSDVVEAQYWHDDTKKDEVICGSSATGYLGKHRDPLGHNEANPKYENLMTYKHYMSAVRVHAYPADKSAQTISLWGKINKVVVVDQPTECLVTLPSSVDSGTGKSGYGAAVFSDDKRGSFDLVRTSMFGDDANNDVHFVADEVSTLEKYTQSSPMKLGYALIAPEKNLVLDVHTDAGVYRVEIEADNDGDPATANLFQEGRIYDLTLEFQTSNKIAALILSDAGYDYFDLTAGKVYDASYGHDYYDYKHSNCYVIYPDIAGAGETVDGFCFDVTVVGNGESGILPGFERTTATINPVSAGLIWESSYGLIQQIELLYGYVRFRVPAYKTVPGNAVIGVFDEKGDVLWSWHIWITDTAPSAITYNLGSAAIEVMDRNLGALTVNPTDAATALKSYGLYYQWGRKDPSMYPPSYDYRPMSTATSVYYDGFGDTQQSTGVINISRPAIGDGVSNPMYMILPTEWSAFYQFDWLYNRVDNLWGGAGPLRTKTIYDPCPEGYWVPGGHLDLILQHAKTNGGFNAETYAMRVENGDYDLFFPYAGYKGVDRGMSSLVSTWKYVGQKGDYMNAQVLADKSRGRGYVSKSPDGWEETGTDGKQSVNYQGGHFNIDAGGANRRTAATVRCVKAEPFGSVQIYLTSEKDRYSYGETVSGTYEYVVHGDVMYNMEYDVQYGFSSSSSSSSSVTEWFEGTIDEENFSYQWILNGAGLPQEKQFMWIKMSVKLTDMDVVIDKSICCTYLPENSFDASITFEKGRYIFSDADDITGTYTVLTNDQNADVKIEFAVSDGFSEPSSWIEATSSLSLGDNCKFNISAKVNDTDISYVTDLWLRLKVTLSDSEVKYSDPIQCLLFPDIVASSASKYDVLNTPPAKLSVYDYYVLSMRFKEFSHVLAFNDDEQGIILPAQRIYADNKRHIVQVSDIASGNYINNTSYNTQYKCKMKAAYNGKYLYWDSSSSAIKLTSNSEQASEFVFCCDWGKIPGTDKDFVEIYVLNQNKYLRWDNMVSNGLLTIGGAGNSYQWIVAKILQPKY